MTPELTEERIAEALARAEKAASGSDNARCFALPDPSVESEWARIATAPASGPLRLKPDPGQGSVSTVRHGHPSDPRLPT